MKNEMNRFGFYSNYNSSRNSSYLVQKGDSLYSIAKKYGVSVEDLIASNDLTSSIIYPDQVIVIPQKNLDGLVYFEEYVIKPDDTIEKIGEKLNVNVNTIAKYNDLTKLLLVADQIITIPFEYSTYQISNDDTLLDILEKTNMTLEELILANASTWLQPGTIIYVK